MRKLFVIGFIALFMLTACDPIEHEEKYVAHWYVKNTSDVSLKIWYPRLRDYIRPHSEEPQIIEPGDYICMYMTSRTWADNEIPLFDEFLEIAKYVVLYDNEDNVLQEWSVDNMSIDEYSIFYEQNWSFYTLDYQECREYFTVLSPIESLLVWVCEINYNNLSED